MTLAHRILSLAPGRGRELPPPNMPRFAASRVAGGHVESWFLRANDPNAPRAVWIKSTITASPGGQVAEAWFIFFDASGDTPRTWAHRETIPLSEAVFAPRAGGDLHVEIGRCGMELADEGSAAGAMTRAETSAAWDLRWSPVEGGIAAPVSILPWDAMLTGPFPKSKLLTPVPALRMSGTIDCFGERVELDGWHGMQGHNWGREHAWEYAWGQCLFEGGHGDVHTMVEGFSARILLAGRPTPRMSALIVRRGDRELRFDRVFDVWRQTARIDDMTWQLRLRGPDGDADLRMEADPAQMVCLGYHNPDGRLSYCLNSKLAKVRLRVNPVNADAFECESAHGGALELLRNTPDPRLPEVI